MALYNETSFLANIKSKNMQELNEILKREQEQQEIITAERVKASDLISRKQNELAAKLSQDISLTKEAKDKIFAVYQEQAKEVEISFQRELKLSSGKMQKAAKENFKPAVEYLLKELIAPEPSLA